MIESSCFSRHLALARQASSEAGPVAPTARGPGRGRARHSHPPRTKWSEHFNFS